VLTAQVFQEPCESFSIHPNQAVNRSLCLPDRQAGRTRWTPRTFRAVGCQSCGGSYAIEDGERLRFWTIDSPNQRPSRMVRTLDGVVVPMPTFSEVSTCGQATG